MDDQIQSLQADINQLDPSTADVEKSKLVAVQTLQLSDFKHYIEINGKVDAENISFIAPSGNPGLVKAIYVKQGDL
ncbi:MAG: hypothetical protein WDM71_11295 [Ferruginibacter sp.]